MLSICKKLVKLWSATTGLKATFTFDADCSLPDTPNTREFIELKNASLKRLKLVVEGRIESNSKKNSDPIIAPKGRFCVYSCPVSINSTNRKFSIIITNRNKIAIAPT